MFSYLPDAAESEENTSVMYDNMVLLADFLVDMRAEMRRRRLQEEELPTEGTDCTKSSTFQVQVG